MRIFLPVVMAVVAGGAVLLVSGTPGDRTPRQVVVAKSFATALREQNVDDAERLLDDRAKGSSPGQPSPTEQAVLQVRALEMRSSEVDLTSEFYVTGDRVDWLMAYRLSTPDADPNAPPHAVEEWHEVTVADGRVVSFSLTPTAQTAPLALALTRIATPEVPLGPQTPVPIPVTPSRDQMQDDALAHGATVVGLLPEPGPSPLLPVAAAVAALLLSSVALQVADRKARVASPSPSPRLQGRLVRGLRPMLTRRETDEGGLDVRGPGPHTPESRGSE